MSRPSDEIAEGIDKSIYGQVLKYAMYFIIGISVFFIILLLFGLLHEKLYPKTYVMAAEPYKCNYPEVKCRIKDLSEFAYTADCTLYIQKEHTYACSDAQKFNPDIFSARFCGYQEANAWFENFKDNYQGNKSALSMECEY